MSEDTRIGAQPDGRGGACTEKLFWEDAFLREFTARVLDCRPAGEGWAVTLDRTAFNPEGGGQTADTGTLDDAAVTVVRERGGVILHLTDRPLLPGARVRGALDWAERFRKMQNHTGEHILSGLAHSLWGCENVGFHLGSEGCTLDFDRELTGENLRELERRANEVVWQNVPVTARFPSPEELAALPYRSKGPVEGQVRVVTIAGVDSCACCAPHVSATGQIGAVKLTDSMRHRGGMRLQMKAGSDALGDYAARVRSFGALSAALNVPWERTPEAVDRLLKERDELRITLHALRMDLARRRAAELPETPGDLLLFFDGGEEELRELANTGREKCGGVCAVFSGADGDYRFVMASRTADMRAFAKYIREPLSARGGGQERMISGRSAAPRAVIEAFFQAR